MQSPGWENIMLLFLDQFVNEGDNWNTIVTLRKNKKNSMNKYTRINARKSWHN